MAADLSVSFALRCAVGEVQPFEYGILAELLSKPDDCLLMLPFFGKFLFFGSSLQLKVLIVSEEVELHRLFSFPDESFRLQTVDGQGQSPYKKYWIDYSFE